MVKRENTRTSLAYSVTAGLGAVTLALIIWAFIHGTELETILTGIFTPLIGIAGTVIGFYFAGDRTR
jgi:hypothetical protein